MAQWIAINTMKLSLGKGTFLIREGDVIDDTLYNLTPLLAAGLQLIPATDTWAASAQALAKKQARKGNRDDNRISQPWWGMYGRKGSVTVANTANTATLTFTGNEPDTNYFAVESCTGLTSGANAQSAIVTGITKNIGNVVITVQTAPGAGQSATYDVIIIR